MSNAIQPVRMALSFCFMAAILLLPGPDRALFSQTALKAGDIVFAEWTPNGWYHGKIEKKCDIGWHVQFDDGDQKCCHPDTIARDAVPAKNLVRKGSLVLAQWTDGRFYPGVVVSVEGDVYSIQFDDGDSRSVGIEMIRLR